MTIEFESNPGLNQELEMSALFANINAFLDHHKPLFELRRLDAEVAEMITGEEYEKYLSFKRYCLEELGELNTTPGQNGALCSAIERGFIIGYWLGRQRPD